MARVKFFNKKTGKWEYADSAYGSGGTVTDEQIASAVEDYFEEHPVTGGGNVDVTFEGETMIISTANNAVKIDGETLIL